MTMIPHQIFFAAPEKTHRHAWQCPSSCQKPFRGLNAEEISAVISGHAQHDCFCSNRAVESAAHRAPFLPARGPLRGALNCGPLGRVLNHQLFGGSEFLPQKSNDENIERMMPRRL